MRQDVYDLFARYEPQFQYHWNQIIASGFEAFAAESAKHAAAMGLNQSLEWKIVFWENAQGNLEALFFYIIDPQDLESIIAMYQEVKKKKVPVSYAIIE